MLQSIDFFLLKLITHEEQLRTMIESLFIQVFVVVFL